MLNHHHGQRDGKASNFMMWAACVLFLVFGTAWLINHLYNTEWAASDPRGFEGQSRMIQSQRAAGEILPEPTALPAPAFGDFKRTDAK